MRHPADTPDAPPASLLALFLDQEAPRRAVGRALHDQLGQAFSAIKMAAHLTLDEDDPAQRRQDLQDIAHSCDEMVALLRRLHAALHPPQLEAIGLHAALRAELERHGLALRRVELDPPAAEPAPEIALAAFRIAQALLATLAAQDTAADAALRLHGDSRDLYLDLDTPPTVQAPAWLPALAAAAGGELHRDAAAGHARWRLRLPCRLPSMPPAA